VDADAWEELFRYLLWIIIVIAIVATLGSPIQWFLVMAIRASEGDRFGSDPSPAGWAEIRDYVREHPELMYGVPYAVDQMMVVAWQWVNPAARPTEEEDGGPVDALVIDGTATPIDAGPHQGREFILQLHEREALAPGGVVMIEAPASAAAAPEPMCSRLPPRT